ncbi:hypothetical protein [Nonomuraea diastatica]|uniref:Uncharacterized protein n=1 Tax=Nonomuraea diastatica TaxID=1848329 RepID=A0A4R4WMG2_9ACTN|nr:hypothetical protein [Nonomuraea diastatica]TDD20272.1 hypothetical protein E1294_18385 [Nonomuraea diastatica]
MRLHRIGTRMFGEGRPFLSGRAHELMSSYVEDVTHLHGLPLRPGYMSTRRNSYAEMAEAMVPELGPLPAPVDVLALASAVPDADLIRSPASLLAELLPGDPFPLGVTDQGVVAPFTALKILRTYGASNCLLMVMDQQSLPYDVAGTEEMVPLRDCAAALVFTDGGAVAEGFEVRHCTEIPPERVAGLLAAELGGHTALVAGRGLAATLPNAFEHIRLAPPGLPCTGVWVALAAALPGWRGRRVAVADYDRTMRNLSICTLDTSCEAG